VRWWVKVVRFGVVMVCWGARDAIAVPGESAARDDSVRVVISGARRFAPERVRSWVVGSDGMRRVAREYALAGYWSAVISDSSGRAADGGSVRRIEVHEGPHVVIAEDSLSSALNSPADVPDRITGLLRTQAERGHPFAEVELAAAREPETGHILLEMKLRPGPLVRIAGVSPTGNTVTRTEVIARELRQPVGSAYNQREVERWKRRLERMGYFETVSEPGLVWRDSSAGLADLVIAVSEGRPNRFEGVVGYQPGSAGERGQFTGLADLALGNLWGTGRLLSVRWNRPQPGTTTLDLAYREPWVAGYPVDAEGRVGIEQRTGYALERIEMAFGGEIVPDLTMSASVGREVVRSDSLPLLGGPRHRGVILRGIADYDTRDVPQNPARGLRYHLDWSYVLRRNRVNDADFVALVGPDSWPAQEKVSTVRLDLEHYFPFGRAFVLALGWHGAQVTSTARRTSFSAADQLRLGGALSVRGYRQEQFLGDRAVWGNHEWRYRIGAASRLFAFVDVGAVRSRRTDPDTQETVSTTAWPVGYGVGVRARTAAGVLGIDFGWGRHDSFGQGKVHVRLETTF